MTVVCNDREWRDDRGEVIDCHEGMVLPLESGGFVWYGRRYAGNDEAAYGRAGARYRCGFDAYLSPDLVTWTRFGPILEYPESGPLTEGTWHRPRVAFSRATGRFVLWFFHLVTDPEDSVVTVVAEADSPTGPFRIVGPAETPGYTPSGDLDLLVSSTGEGYLANGDWDRNALVAPLRADLRATSGVPAVALRAAGRQRFEGYAMVEVGGRVLLAASGVAGIGASETSYAVADHALGPYGDRGVMSEESTWGCQISSLLKVPGTDAVVALCDRWLHDFRGRRVPARASAQQWYPIDFDGERARMIPARRWDPRDPVGSARAERAE